MHAVEAIQPSTYVDRASVDIVNGLCAAVEGDERSARRHLESKDVARYMRDAGLVLDEYGAFLFATTGRGVQETLEKAGQTYEDVGPDPTLFMSL
jgi:hypothetical protein